ncbi:MAG TPA: peptidase S10 [Gammaproteobacteria bacterium]|nr:peptidase S10 [Gammaproteobacteria bacterium]
MKKFPSAIPLLLILAISLPAFAEDASAQAATQDGNNKELPVPKETSAVTQHRITLDGDSFGYTATAGNLVVANDKGDAIGSFFYVAYTRDGVRDMAHRPLTFLFNGGPGSSSIWLHMGSFGPVRVETSDAQATPPPPYTLVSNRYSLLDKSDLVFIDAMGTGFSRIVGKGTGKDFYGTDADIESFGKFIERYVTLNKRWNSPKFLLGESYGTTRAAGLVDWLQNQGMAFNGVILQSSWLNGFVDFPGPANALDLSYELYLPTMAATAWYHGKLANKPADFDAFIQQARDFALGDYARALDRGSRLSAAETRAIAEKLASYTGLSTDYILRAKLRVNPFRFEKELLRDQAHTVGRLDSRFPGTDQDAAGEYPEYDPSGTAIGPAYTAAFNWYLANDLKYKTDLGYKVQNYREVGRDWDNSQRIDGQTYPLMDVEENLRRAMTENPHLKVFSANGYFDFATPFFETEYDLDHMGLDASLMKNISYGYYQSGHMIYLKVPALKAYKADVARFYDSAVTP